ncbi:tetratricopeptide repeat protein [Frateuria sp. YIM B11624]|uniref:tetratricopeptide repeat protein n=1 Tax=Frateuria sp. YIM B11624 TaxID=3143185 RepID=UPI003C7349C9
MQPSTRAALLLIVILAGCTAVYWAGLHGPFLFDDFPNLAALDSIDRVANWRDLGLFLSEARTFPGRPLAMLSFLLQKSSWPDDPFAFKLVNLGLHLANGVLVYVLTKQLSAIVLADGTAPLKRLSPWPPLLVTAAWLVCPINLSAILLVVQRMTLLMALFVLLGLIAYTSALKNERASIRRRGALMVTGLGVGTTLAFLTKENGILLPLYALALDTTLLRTRVQQLPPVLAWLRRLLVYPMVLFVFGYLLIEIPDFARAESFRDFTLYQRLLTEPRILADYLAKIFLPRFGVYGLYNDDFPLSSGIFHPLATPFFLAALLLVLGLAFRWRQRRPLLAFAVFWYFGGQILESSVVMLELYFEHRNYLPIIGPFIALAIWIATLSPSNTRRLVYAIVTVWFGASVIATSLSARVWSSEQGLAFNWGNTHPDSVRSQTMLAGQLYKHGRLAAAARIIDRVMEKHPGDAGLAENKVLLRCVEGSLTAADLDQLRETLRTARWNRNGFQNLETIRLQAQMHRCPPLTTEQWSSLADALLANRAYQWGIAAGFIHYQISQLAVHEGNLDLAVRQLDLAYAKDPDANIPRLQAKYLASAGLYDQAIDKLEQTDYRRLPLLRRLLVDDRAINREMATTIREKQASALNGRKTGKPQEQAVAH